MYNLRKYHKAMPGNRPNQSMKLSYSSTKMQKVEMKRKIMRGEMYYADLSPVVGSEQGGMRPILILQNNIGNKNSPTVVVAAITSQLGKSRLPTHVKLDPEHLLKDSIVLLEQLRTIDKCRLTEYIGKVTENEMKLIEDALLVSVGMDRRDDHAI